MAKKLDLSKSVYTLVKQYPELVDIMADLGFTEIKNKVMLNSVARMMTIPKGATAKNIPMPTVIAALIKNGFELTGEMPMDKMAAAAKEDKDETSASEPVEGTNKEQANKSKHESNSDEAGENRRSQLKEYLKRLNQGESLESVRADFVKEFESVDPTEIMKAEQELIAGGEPLADVQKLCDVHSALFHGDTDEERLENARKAEDEAVARSKAAGKVASSVKGGNAPKADYTDKNEKAAALAKIKGHPLYTFTKENEKLGKLIKLFNAEVEAESDVSETLKKIRDVSVHYAKKGDLLYPHLKVKYEISGPSDVMWTVDDEIRDELGTLSKEENRDKEWLERVKAVVKRADEMIFKENNILFPICAVNFTEEEWQGIYRDSKDYSEAFGVVNEVWDEAEKTTVPSSFAGGEIVMPGGHMNVEQLAAMLDTLPFEITFVDNGNINRYYNNNSEPKAFKRPGMSIDREVFSCHPPKIEPLVRTIIEELRSGAKDEVPVWLEKNGKTYLVRYMAVRDKNKKYLGVVEVVQNMEFAKEHFTEENSDGTEPW